MSYINDALKKAQQERDSRYERFGGLISSGPVGAQGARKRRLIRGMAIMVVILIPAGLLLAGYVLREPSPASNRELPPLAAESPAAFDSPPKQAGEGAVSAGETAAEPLPEKAPLPAKAAPADKTIAAARPEKAPLPVKTAPADRTTGGKPAPGEVDARYKEALAAQRRGDLSIAEVLYEEVLALDPGHVRALNNLGILYMGRKQRQQAIALLVKAIALKKEYVDPYYNLACLYARTNEIDASLRYLKVAVTMNGDVINWAKQDADLKHVVESPAFKKMMEGQKN